MGQFRDLDGQCGILGYVLKEILKKLERKVELMPKELGRRDLKTLS